MTEQQAADITTADRVSALFERIWEGGLAYDLSFETTQGRDAGKIHNVNDVVERLWPHAWAARVFDDGATFYRFDDGSQIRVDQDGAEVQPF